MKILLLILAHLLTTLARLLGPGGAKAIVADSLLMKRQLLVINRSRKRAPNLSVLDRFLLGFWSLFLSPHHIVHMLLLDGVYVERPDGFVRFRWVKAPTSAELTELADRIAQRVGRFLE